MANRPVALHQANLPQPPSQLGEPGAALWRQVHREWDVTGIGELTVLEQCCFALDRAERLRLQIEETGEQIALPGGSMKANPLVAAELSARNLVVKLLSRLGVLDTGPKRGPGRPPSRTGGW